MSIHKTLYLCLSCIGGLDSLLYGDDAIEILQEIVSIKAKYEIFGFLLKVPRVIICSLKDEYRDPQDCLLHIIDEFLNGDSPRPTWRVIITVLRHPLLNYCKLALQIERTFSGNG